MEELSKKLESMKMALECPVCLSLPESTPIYQCENGHIICKSCHQFLEDCPQCRRPLGNNRNLLAESFLEAFCVQCPFTEQGCEVKILPDNVEDHKKNCVYRQVLCPVNGCVQDVSVCKVVIHLREAHDKNRNISGKFSLKLKSVAEAVNWISHEDLDFLVMKKISPLGHWHFWVNGFGNPEQMAKFSYLISVYAKEGSARVSSEDEVLSFDKSAEDVFRDGNGLVVTEKVLNRLQKSGQISYTVTITRKKE